MFNERAVCQAIIDCCAELEWPAQRLKIQVRNLKRQYLAVPAAVMLAMSTALEPDADSPTRISAENNTSGYLQYLKAVRMMDTWVTALVSWLGCCASSPPFPTLLSPAPLNAARWTPLSPGLWGCPHRDLAATSAPASTQVLDDSTDSVTRELVDEKVLEWRERGIVVECLRRTNRQGYKAGAMKEVGRKWGPQAVGGIESSGGR
jgi:hypothetical protein